MTALFVRNPERKRSSAASEVILAWPESCIVMLTDRCQRSSCTVFGKMHSCTSSAQCIPQRKKTSARWRASTGAEVVGRRAHWKAALRRETLGKKNIKTAPRTLKEASSELAVTASEARVLQMRVREGQEKEGRDGGRKKGGVRAEVYKGPEWANFVMIALYSRRRQAPVPDSQMIFEHQKVKDSDESDTNWSEIGSGLN
ncbi:hypothetical protein C8F01DRAFT_1076873 [Mycena amicta]|nr:hypothetical protein C8F01DRAFT_1076873 [Mycena amicta]